MSNQSWRGAWGLFLLLALISACRTPALKQVTVFHPEKLAEIDAAVTRAIEEKKCPGGVFWLEHRGETYHKAYGSRSIVPVSESTTEDTIYDAASLTKVVAATPALMLLIERGQVDLDDPVKSYIPEFIGGGKDEITVRHVLTHTSGLRPGIETRSGWSGTAAALEKIASEKTVATPGSQFRYSDLNFILVGEMVRRASKIPLEQFVTRELYRPLGMKDTGYLPQSHLQVRIAPTELENGDPLRGVVHDPTARLMGGVAGHAGLFTTATDLARFARMLLNQGELDGVRVFKPETVQLMTSVQTAGSLPVRRGLGWDIDSPYSGPRGELLPLGSYGHTGWTGGSLWIDPFSHTFVIFLSNRNHPDEKGNVLPLRRRLGTLAAEAIRDYNFAYVPGALAPRPASASGRSQAKAAETLNGIDVLGKRNFAPLRNLRIGLITNHTGHDRERNPTIDVLAGAPGVQLKALFAPEHGMRGLLDERVSDSVDERTGLPIHSLYGETRRPTPEQLSELDALVFDVQDIGCRFYTYSSTMAMAMEAAAEQGIQFIVLDRVNPINGLAVEGPILNAPPTFVGYHAVPLRHGMTVGELARMFQTERGCKVKLTVIPLENWRRELWLDETGLPWTNPSPNMRALTQATLYPGVGLLESAVSVGRGTDTPFEMVGAPYVNDLEFARELNAAGLPGLRFIPVRFTPSASVHKGENCGGVRILVTDREICPVVDVGLLMAHTLHRLYPRQFNIGKISHLLLEPQVLALLKSSESFEVIRQSWRHRTEAFKQVRAKYLLY